MYPIYVIHIESAIERANSIQEQFKKLKLSFNFFPAINAKQYPNHPLFTHYNAQKHFWRKGRNLSIGELGCFASHYSLWKKCTELNTPIIILEDDVIILDNFKQFYENANKFVEKYPFIWLHKNYRPSKKILINTINNISIVKFYKDYFCAMGYIITPEAAKQLLNYCEEWIYPVDDQMARFYENKIENFAIEPPCIDKSNNMDSLIGDACRTNKNLSLYSKLRREYFNLKDRIKRKWHNLLFRCSN
ncbi:glycosyl transferase [Gallibacterium salpingitidis]|uniref:Glycosyl transferase n=1 Tax=Gallibacterium salpingitidis TaxID=505341 RepID=A0AB36E3N1_9PAST|nr:glycosyltransferase family 25 protein [Gallibacterium salpingitidis]OBX11186.1 glycosyl transferase [Gallibacterium salpingitidis]